MRVGKILFVSALLLSGAGTVRAADDFTIDPVHSSVSFKISHLGLSWIAGRFDKFSGNFTIDPEDAGRCSFNMAINADSIDTNNTKRNDHLRSPDFFNVKQFPEITFKSTAVKAAKDGYEVTGEFTMHGVSKPLTFTLSGGRRAEFPRGVQRTGFSTDLTLKKSDFGIGEKFAQLLGDEVLISVGFEGTKK
jgi:polyisoprenoid-binding protein YceI